MPFKYGRKPRHFDARIPHLSALLAGKKLSPPSSCDYLSKMPDSLGMMGNDTLGDCTIAGLYHARQAWSFSALNDMRTAPDSDVIATYSKFCGYVPGNPSTDQGGDLQTVLTDFLNDGIPIATGAVNKIGGFVEVDPRNLTDVQAVIDWGCLTYIGINIPQWFSDALDNGQLPNIWDVEPNEDNTIVAGHCIVLPAYDQDFGLISWGQKYVMTQAFFSAFCDEAYGLADEAWITYSGKTLGGWTLAQLTQQMGALQS